MHNAATAAARYENTTTAGGQEGRAQREQPVQHNVVKINKTGAHYSAAVVGQQRERERGGRAGAGSLAHCGCCRPTWPLQVSAKKPTATAAAAASG